MDKYNTQRKAKLELLSKAVDKHGLGSKQHLAALKVYEAARTNYGVS